MVDFALTLECVLCVWCLSELGGVISRFSGWLMHCVNRVVLSLSGHADDGLAYLSGKYDRVVAIFLQADVITLSTIVQSAGGVDEIPNFSSV